MEFRLQEDYTHTKYENNMPVNVHNIDDFWARKWSIEIHYIDKQHIGFNYRNENLARLLSCMFEASEPKYFLVAF